MRIPFSLVFALLLSFDTFAAPVPNAQAGDEFVRRLPLNDSAEYEN
jgi:hypothetical protein